MKPAALNTALRQTVRLAQYWLGHGYPKQANDVLRNCMLHHGEQPVELQHVQRLDANGMSQDWLPIATMAEQCPEMFSAVCARGHSIPLGGSTTQVFVWGAWPIAGATNTVVVRYSNPGDPESRSSFPVPVEFICV